MRAASSSSSGMLRKNPRMIQITSGRMNVTLTSDEADLRVQEADALQDEIPGITMAMGGIM